MSKTSIRNFTPADKATVMEMVEKFYTSPRVLHEINPKNFEDVYDEMCDGGSARLRGLLIEINGQTAGFCQLSFGYSTEAGGTVVYLEEIYIKRDYRGHGAGSRVLEFVRDEYRGKAARLRLEVVPSNDRAIALYERFGFERLPYIQMKMEDF